MGRKSDWEAAEHRDRSVHVLEPTASTVVPKTVGGSRQFPSKAPWAVAMGQGLLTFNRCVLVPTSVSALHLVEQQTLGTCTRVDPNQQLWVLFPIHTNKGDLTDRRRTLKAQTGIWVQFLLQNSTETWSEILPFLPHRGEEE